MTYPGDLQTLKRRKRRRKTLDCSTRTFHAPVKRVQSCDPYGQRDGSKRSHLASPSSFVECIPDRKRITYSRSPSFGGLLLTAVPNRAGRVSNIIVMYIANQGVIIFDRVKQGKPKGLRLSLHYSRGVARIFLQVGTIFRTPPAWKLNFPTFPDNHR